MRETIEKLEKIWCEVMHRETMWPIHGAYRCGVCLREYPVVFAGSSGRAPAAEPVPEFFAPAPSREAVSLAVTR
jgi:hypothetical protein